MDSIYSPLPERRPAPALFAPTVYALMIWAVATTSQSGRIGIGICILALVAYAPNLDTGSAASDYIIASFLIQNLAQTVLDLAILAPREGQQPRYTGSDPGSGGKGLEDCSSVVERLVWAFRLQTTSRGIGWDWQVNNVPTNPDTQLPRWSFVQVRLLSAVRHWVITHLCVVAVGMLEALQSGRTHMLFSAAFAWFALVHVYHGLQYAYDAAAAITVAIGVCSQWQWPPIVGAVKEAYTVRRAWGVTYHQIIRRYVQQPGVRLARFLGLRKGSNASSYLQLYLAFTLSFALHRWNMFSTTRQERGEFNFFLTQPLAITAEDLVIWCSKRVFGDVESTRRVLRWVGYGWMVLWFSYCLPPFIKGLQGLLMLPAYGDSLQAWCMGFGAELATKLLS